MNGARTEPPSPDASGATFPAKAQDERTIVAIERDQVEQWLHGTEEDAAVPIMLPPHGLYAHGMADPDKQAQLPLMT